MNVVQAFPLAPRLQPASVKDVQQQITDFLGVPLPPTFDQGVGEIKLIGYESGITGLIRERKPWLIIDRCVATESVSNTGKRLVTVWGVTTFTPDMVAGHFPGHPKVPFVDLAKMIAQIAIVAAALQANDPLKAPIGVGSSGSAAEATDLIPVPATVLAKVSVQAYKMGLCTFGDSNVFVDGEQVGTVSGVRYLLRPSPELLFT